MAPVASELPIGSADVLGSQIHVHLASDQTPNLMLAAGPTLTQTAHDMLALTVSS